MKVEAETLERLVALLTLGMAVAIEHGKLTTEEAGHLLFSPHSMALLKECGVRKTLVDLVHTGTEMEDVERLIPEELSNSLQSLQDEALDCLATAGPYDFNAEKWLSLLGDPGRQPGPGNPGSPDSANPDRG